MEPLAPITMNIRLVALAVTVILSVIVVGPIVYFQTRSTSNDSAEA